MLLKAARFAFIGLAATTLMGQIVGVRLIAPVDAAPNYEAQCDRRCEEADTKCFKNCKSGKAGEACRESCTAAERSCVRSCDADHDNDEGSDRGD